MPSKIQFADYSFDDNLKTVTSTVIHRKKPLQ